MTLASTSQDGPQAVVFPTLGCPRTGTEASIQVYVAGSWTVFEAVGELSWVVTRGLRELLRSTPSTALVFDLRQTTYVDHNALAVLAHAHRTRRSHGGAVRLVEPPRSTRTLLRLSGAHDLPPVFATIEEATA